MPRGCKTCSHPDIQAINKAIARLTPILQIANKYGLNNRTLETHANNCVRKKLKKVADAAAERALVKIVEVREEVNYAGLQKSKWMQDRIAGLLDEQERICAPMSDITGLMRELRGWVDMEHKLCGNYMAEKPNPIDEKLNQVKTLVQAEADRKGTTFDKELNLYLKVSPDVLPEVKEKLVSERVM